MVHQRDEDAEWEAVIIAVTTTGMDWAHSWCPFRDLFSQWVLHRQWVLRQSPSNWQGSEVHCCIFSRWGPHRICIFRCGTIRFWDANSRSAVGNPLQGHTHQVQSAV